MRQRLGFTLIELLVATVAATALSLTALQVFGAYHRLYLHLYGSYQKESAAILEELRRMNPYHKKMPDLLRHSF